jgi:pantothenate kinase
MRRMEQLTLDEAAAAAGGLLRRADGSRVLLGLTGPPGAGKSTLTGALLAELGELAVVVPMDGFHLAQAELERLCRADRKGAPDTFDAAGFVALLRRLRAADEPVVYAPEFRRELEEPIGCALPVPADVPLVLVEGNYLLLDDPAWAPVRPLLDECWYLQPDDELRVDRLVARHVAHGRSPQAAREWVLRSDEANARLVAASKHRADRVVLL